MNTEIFEIERKFLVEKIPENLDKFVVYDIKQGYISTDPTIRLRQQNDKFILTVKGMGTIKKLEYELPLSKEQFDKLWLKVEGNAISKKRFIIPLDENLNAELDIYEDNLKGFMNVEVEFPSTETALLFTPPEWFGKEVTQDRRYSNASLAKFGIPLE